MKLIIIGILLRIVLAVITFSDKNVTAISSGLKVRRAYEPEEEEEDEEGDEDTEDGPYLISIDEPLYLETIGRSSISIIRPTLIVWSYRGKPHKPPKSLTITLSENKGTVISHVLATNIDPKKRKFLWDIPNYRPSTNEDEAITLKLESSYVLYVHDSKLPFNSPKRKGSYHVGAKTITFYRPGNVYEDFNSNFSLCPSIAVVSIITILSLLCY